MGLGVFQSVWTLLMGTAQMANGDKWFVLLTKKWKNYRVLEYVVFSEEELEAGKKDRFVDIK